MKFVIIGLSVTSSWGNGHATTYRALLKELAKLGHDILFLEKDVPWYAPHRDLPNPGFCKMALYETNEELWNSYADEVANADVVIVGSYVQQGVEVGEWVIKTAKGIKAFYDIDTPVTLAKLQRQDYEYITPELISKYDIYLSFTGGSILQHLEQHYGSPAARALYCSVDPEQYYPENKTAKWELGYLGTYSDDRQPTVNLLLNNAATAYPEGTFVVAGPQYPESINWPENVERIEHLPPALHRDFYNTQKYTLNVTRQDMIKAGYSPSVRLFEAAACGVPIISDYWDGLTSLFEEGSEILIARNTQDVLNYLNTISDEERRRIGENARKKVLKGHTAEARAKELEEYIREAIKAKKFKALPAVGKV
ncbi:glycosyltransferase [Flavobacterium cyanobacteriorum]|uniref:Glycosyltransferase n=1 Tax=Flavobacterium cyanobacteriorum TaxID=2022802 RepID=A0A255YXN3_9FLAO|nr:glycosyltransferase [Flavobacterium cyanobacteriorum]OYQ33180.1 glycosyltransferase [Flavobacterium cyanobacteriorum]